jgi:hypothetical protein
MMPNPRGVYNIREITEILGIGRAHVKEIISRELIFPDYESPKGRKYYAMYTIIEIMMLSYIDENPKKRKRILDRVEPHWQTYIRYVMREKKRGRYKPLPLNPLNQKFLPWGSPRTILANADHLQVTSLWDTHTVEARYFYNR